ncbi:GAF domain-containing protein [Limibacter armeniacum]|uniref:GAF domain-containing protein n=1 Tax=Limibacter armeniacum TaxID=466084 RepID=UPI002FE5E250
MAEDLIIPESASKAEKYEAVLPQIKALITYENDLTANLANVSAALKTTFDFFWVGFYISNGNELVLGPFQGPVACTRIKFDKGVCGAAYSQQSTLLVDDVDKFPGHIACSSASKSEIVVPIIKDGEVKMVLDVDSMSLADFDKTDQKYLEQVADMLAEKF